MTRAVSVTTIPDDSRAGRLVAPRVGGDERHARALPTLICAFQGMSIVAPNLPLARAGGPMEDVEGVTFGEPLGPVPVDGDSVVGAHMVAEFICVEVRGPGPYEVVGGYVSGRAARKRGEVSID